MGLTLKFKERPIKAKTVNYSLQGLGVLLEGRPPIKEGDILHIGQIELGNAGDASVAWTRPEADGTLVGFALIRPIEGCFRHFRFADIVTGFRKSRKTGTFAISDSSGKRVFIKNGEIIFATSEEHQDDLDTFLVKRGKLTEEQYYQVAEKRWTTGMTRAAALVRLGYLNTSELVEAVRLQAEDIVASILSTEDCCFSFKEGVLPEEGLVNMKLQASNLIYRGLKETNSSQILEQYSPAMEDVLRFAASQEDFWAVSLDEEDRRLLTIIDGRRRVSDILRLSPFGDKATMRSLCALLGSGVVEAGEFEVIEEVQEPRAKVIEEVQKSRARGIEDSWVPLGKEKAKLKYREGKRHLDSGNWGAASELFDEAISLDPSEARYYLHKGIALRRQGRIKEAEEVISAAIKLDPSDPDIIAEYIRLN